MSEESKGLTCCVCHSVLFSIDRLITHANNNPGHKYYKYGEGEGVLHIKTLLCYNQSEKYWNNNCEEAERDE